jgi:CheY-like chemotaxis protein
VVAVNTGKEAVAACAAQDFDIILMDVEMPELDGYQATAQIRAQERATGKRTPIIAMTAHAMKGDRERCLAAGMDGYVAKPIRVRELLATLKDILGTDAPSPAGTAMGDPPVPKEDEKAQVG